MQVELSFRDLKFRRYGQGFEGSLTRKGAHRSAPSARRDGGVRRLAAGGYRLRARRYRRMAHDVPVETSPVLRHADRPWGTGTDDGRTRA